MRLSQRSKPDSQAGYDAYCAWRDFGDVTKLSEAVDYMLPMVDQIHRHDFKPILRKHQIEDDGEPLGAGASTLWVFLRNKWFRCTKCLTRADEETHFRRSLRKRLRTRMRRDFYCMMRQEYPLGTWMLLPFGRVPTQTDRNNYMTLMKLDTIILRSVEPKIRFVGKERQLVMHILTSVLQGNRVSAARLQVKHPRKDVQFFIDYAYHLIANEMYILRQSKELVDEDVNEFLGTWTDDGHEPDQIDENGWWGLGYDSDPLAGDEGVS